MRRVAAALGAALVAVAATACGTPGADLFVVHRTGSVPGAELRLRVIDDGQVACDGREPVGLPSDLLIDAREILREIEERALVGRSLPARAGSTMRYAVRTEDGLVRFADNSTRQPRVLYRVQQLVRRIARGPCGLPR